MRQISYPSLFSNADNAAGSHQFWYLSLVRSEYALLLIAAILSMGFSKEAWYFVIFGVVFVVSALVLLVRNIIRPEQNWYFTRALAESVKTLTWRYTMRAAPFDSHDEASDRIDFTKHLEQLLQSNTRAAQAIAGTDSSGDQVTSEMIALRNLSTQERKDFYIEKRIREQKIWYSKKAVWNKNAAKLWTSLGVAIYLFAFVLVMVRVSNPSLELLPIEPLIVSASAVIGWMQIKKFNELASAYTLTANEIGLIQARLDLIGTDSDLSEHINEAERAFSREHTQWVARQDS